MRVILIGPPGSGKGTQSRFIMQRYNIPIISIGDILRDMVIDSTSNLSMAIKGIINTGYLLPDELIISLIEKKIKNMNCEESFLLDGFPRTITQAYAIKSIMKIMIDIVLIFSLSEKSIMKRISGRCMHIPSGRIYHSKFNPPKKDGYDDVTGDPLTFRRDDDEQIVRKRLLEYNCYTAPVINFYYKESKNNSNLRCYFINCERNIYDIQIELIKIFN